MDAEAPPPKSAGQEQLFRFCVLMLFTTLFLPWTQGGEETSPYAIFVAFHSTATTALWSVLAVLLLLTLGSAARPTIRPWISLVTVGWLTVILLSLGALGTGLAYGASLARLFAIGLLVLSAPPALVKTGDLVMRRLNARTAEVFSHWGTALPGLQFSGAEFYTKLEQAIRAHEWPGVEFIRIEHAEAGLLSQKREYLRILRQRQIFDVCAARFGQDYFFTLREGEIRAQVTVSSLLILGLGLFLGLSLCVSLFGLVSGPLFFGGGLLAGLLVLIGVLRMGLVQLDGYLLRAPVLGPIYENFFRRSHTYFQHDTRMVFLKLMDDLVKAQVEEETSAKGIKLLSCFEHQPLLDGLYTCKDRALRGPD